jgi:hypothetical protein
MLTDRLIQELRLIGKCQERVSITKLQWLMEELDKVSTHDINALIRKNQPLLKGLHVVINQSYSDRNFRYISNEYLGTLMRILPFSPGCAMHA